MAGAQEEDRAIVGPLQIGKVQFGNGAIEEMVPVEFDRPFQQLPIVVATATTNASHDLFSVSVARVSLTGFEAWIRRIDGPGGYNDRANLFVHYIAVAPR